MTIEAINRRYKDLEDKIYIELELLKDYETKLELSHDPKEKLFCKVEIKKLHESIKENNTEMMSLQKNITKFEEFEHSQYLIEHKNDIYSKLDYFIDNFLKILGRGRPDDKSFENTIDRLFLINPNFFVSRTDTISITIEFYNWLMIYKNFGLEMHSIQMFGHLVRDYIDSISECIIKIYQTNNGNEIKIREIENSWDYAKHFYNDFVRRFNYFIDEINKEYHIKILDGLPLMNIGLK